MQVRHRLACGGHVVAADVMALRNVASLELGLGLLKQSEHAGALFVAQLKKESSMAGAMIKV